MMGESIDVASEPGAGSKFRFTANSGYRPPSPQKQQSLLGCRAYNEPWAPSPINREILEDQLSAGGVATHHTRDDSASLAALRTAALHKEPFGLAIINRLLPDMTGTTATREPSSLVARSPAGSDPIDDQIVNALRRLQRGGRPDIVQQVVQSF